MHIGDSPGEIGFAGGRRFRGCGVEPERRQILEFEEATWDCALGDCSPPDFRPHRRFSSLTSLHQRPLTKSSRILRQMIMFSLQKARIQHMWQHKNGCSDRRLDRSSLGQHIERISLQTSANFLFEANQHHTDSTMGVLETTDQVFLILRLLQKDTFILTITPPFR